MSQVRNILIVDDDEELRSSLAEQIALHEEFLVWEAATAAQGPGTTDTGISFS